MNRIYFNGFQQIFSKFKMAKAIESLYILIQFSRLKTGLFKKYEKPCFINPLLPTPLRVQSL